MTPISKLKYTGLTIATGMIMATTANADNVILDDLIVDGSACVGMDCVNGESFGFDTIRVKENNVRIGFTDTSASASFPSNDWELTANDSSNGGANRFSITDISGGRTPFTTTAGAPSNSIFINASGNVGLNTNSPIVELHIIDGDSPTIRLQQDGSSGFGAQTWDLAGNETNFFIRDVNNGSKLPFKILPGADHNVLVLHGDERVGINTNAPSVELDVRGTARVLETGNLDVLTPHLKIENTNGVSAQRHMLSLENDGTPYLSLINNSVAAGDNTGMQWNVFNAGGLFEITSAPGGANDTEFSLDNDGNLTLSGHLITTGGGGACTAVDPCDAVFDPELYTVPSIQDHAAEMWANKHLPAVGPVGADAPINMTEKMLRMLNELEHAHIYIEQLDNRIQTLEAELEDRKG